MIKKRQVIMVECALCHGRGIRPAADTGAVMRLEREGRGVSRTALAPHFLKPDGEPYSFGYLRDLEGGNRGFSVELIEAYRRAIDAAIEQRLSKLEVGV